GNGYDYTRRVVRSNRLRRGAHCRSRRQSIVDENHTVLSQSRRGEAVAVRSLTARKLLCLFARHALDRRVWYSVPAHNVLVEYAHAAGRNGAHRALAMPWRPELAHEEHIERGAER